MKNHSSFEGFPKNATVHSAFGGYYRSIAVGPLVVWSVLHSLVAVFIILSNTLVIISFIKNANLRTRTNCLIASLAMADFLVGLVSVPGWLVLIYREDDQRSIWYVIVMEVWYVFEILGGVGSIFHLMALSWDRLCAIVWPLRHRSYTKTKYLVMIFMTWSLASLISGLSVTGNRVSPKAYNISVIFLCFFLPLVLIFVAQGITLITIKRNTAKFSHNSTLKRDVRAAKTIAIMIGLFLIGWLPFFSLGLVRYVHDDFWVLPAHAIFAVKLLQYSNSLFNPILYGQNFPEFRKAYIKILCSEKSYNQAKRSGTSSFVKTSKSRTSTSTLYTSCPPPPRSPGFLLASIKKGDERRPHVTSEDSALLDMVSGL